MIAADMRDGDSRASREGHEEPVRVLHLSTALRAPLSRASGFVRRRIIVIPPGCANDRNPREPDVRSRACGRVIFGRADCRRSPRLIASWAAAVRGARPPLSEPAAAL